MQITAIAIIVILMCVACIPLVRAAPINNHQDQECSSSECPSASSSPTDYLIPYVGELTCSAVPHAEHPIIEFPAYFSKAVFPGWMSGENNDLCMIPKRKMPSFSDCEKYADEMHQSFKGTYPEFYAQVMQNPEYTSEKGYAIVESEIDDGISLNKVSVGVDERIINNYKKAIHYIEENVLQNSSFFTGDSGKIVEAIKTTNRLVSWDLVAKPGEFRIAGMIVYDGKLKEDGQKETPWDTLKRKGGTQQDFRNWKAIEKKAKILGGSIGNTLGDLTEEELRTFKKIAFIASPHEKIEGEMFELADRIQDLAQNVILGEADAVAAAAFVHQEIGRIHAFENGNGRTARLWLSIMLQLGGIKGVVIPNEEEYMAAVIEDRKSPGTFYHYLKEVIHWNREQEVLS